jgi:glycosyltransferase involved in cell wall biosynthesis
MIEAIAPDVIHTPHQPQFWQPSSAPRVFHLWDAQHLHHPEFFPAIEIERRETVCPIACANAVAVVVASQWARADVIRHYRVDPGKLHVVPFGAPTLAGPESRSDPNVIRKYQLPDRYLIYPAQTLPHKNHVRLLEAIATIRKRGGDPPHLVCTGRQGSAWPQVRATTRRLRLQSQVHFLGYISTAELRALYRHALAMVFPSLFEGYGLPVMEAFAEGLPVACSNTTSLPEVAGDAALMFDPESIVSIADAIARLASDTALRERLAAAGRLRAKEFTWERTAQAHRAIFRLAAGIQTDP